MVDSWSTGPELALSSMLTASDSGPMTSLSPTIAALHEPITSDWTIRQLLDWLADDDRPHDPALRDRLALIESAATGSGWTREPSTIALIRSLAGAARATPALLATTIRELGRGDMRPAIVTRAMEEEFRGSDTGEFIWWEQRSD